jgi:hypothetical protein
MSEIHVTRIHHTDEVGIYGQNDRWDFKNSVDDDTLSHWMNLTTRDNTTK